MVQGNRSSPGKNEGGKLNTPKKKSSRSLVGRLLSSEVKGDLLVLFRRNPGLIDSSEGVASRIGRRANEIEPDLADLTEIGILDRIKIGRLNAYRLNIKRDIEVQKLVAMNLTKRGGR